MGSIRKTVRPSIALWVSLALIAAFPHAAYADDADTNASIHSKVSDDDGEAQSPADASAASEEGAPVQGPAENPEEPAGDDERRPSIVWRTGEAAVIFGRDTLLDTVRIAISPTQWSAKQWLALGAVGATTGILMAGDDDIRKRAQSNEGFKDFGDSMHKLSNGPLSGAVLGGLALSGMLLERDKDLHTARLGLESFLITGLVVTGLKSVIGRERPRANQGPFAFKAFGGGHSMPSGEVATAFAIAQVVAERYDSWPIRILAYGVAMTVAAGRIGDDAHWASDLFLGAATGIAISHAIMRYDERRKKKKDIELSVMPGGFRVTYHF